MADIKLKPLSEDFIDTLRKWRNENRFYFIYQGVITPEMQKKWYEKYKKDQGDTIYIVFYRGKPVGTISTTIRGEEVEMGRVILGEKKYARQGIMGEATEILLFRFKGKRIFLEVLKDNEVAIAFYKKHGFKVRGKDEKKIVMERFT